MSSISAERIVQGVPLDYLFWQICLNVLLDPMEWTQWESSFWDKCITDWIKRKQIENILQAPSWPKNWKNIQIRKSHKFVRSQLNNLIVTWGVSTKWMVRDTIDNIIEHEKEWSFATLQCINYELWKSLWRKCEIEEHMKSCKIIHAAKERWRMWLHQRIQGIDNIDKWDPFQKLHQEYFWTKYALVDCNFWETKGIEKAKFYEHIKNEWSYAKDYQKDSIANILPVVSDNLDDISESSLNDNIQDKSDWSNNLKHKTLIRNYKNDPKNSHQYFSKKLENSPKEHDQSSPDYFPKFLTMVSYDWDNDTLSQDLPSPAPIPFPYLSHPDPSYLSFLHKFPDSPYSFPPSLNQQSMSLSSMDLTPAPFPHYY